MKHTNTLCLYYERLLNTHKRAHARAHTHTHIIKYYKCWGLKCQAPLIARDLDISNSLTDFISPDIFPIFPL